MKIQNSNNQTGPLGRVLADVDKIRFEDPMFENKDMEVHHVPTEHGVNEGNPNIRSYKEGNTIKILCGGRTPEEKQRNVPHIFGHGVALRATPDMLKEIKLNMLPRDLDLISPEYQSFIEESPERGLLGSYLANRLSSWLFHSAKQSGGFKDYLKKFPPETHILGVLNNALLQL